jgi:hypothetical protein
MKQTRSQLKKKKKAQHFGGRSGIDVFHTAAIREAWDPHKTMQQNYAALGLDMDPNADIKKRIPKVIPDADLRVESVASFHKKLEEAREQTENMVPYVPKSMSVNEQRILQMLIKKHGQNYEAMARDIKINVKQETARQLEKRIQLYNSLVAL